MAGKEAVAFVIDVSPSMASPYPSANTSDNDPDRGTSLDPLTPEPAHSLSLSQQSDDVTMPQSQTSAVGAEAERDLLGNLDEMVQDLANNTNDGEEPKTRLSAAKEACLSMIANLILQSKTNECSVLLCKAGATKHHLCAEEQVAAGTAPFKNIYEISEMNRPTVSLMRDVKAILPSIKAEKIVGAADRNSSTDGDLCDGIIVASDAMFRKTDKRKYKRRLIVFTDAQHEVNVDEDQLMMVVEGLKKLECTLTVIGLDFVNSAEFDKPATEDDADSIDEDGSTDSNNERSDDDDSDDDEDQDITEGNRLARIKDENEKLLISLAKLTGGRVIAASTLQQVLDSTCGKRIPRSTKRKVEFNIAPGLTVQARYSLMLSKASIKPLKKEAVLLDSEGNVKKNGLEEDMMTGVDAVTTHWDADNPDLEVPLDKRTQAYKYGADLIPIGAFDIEGLKIRSPVSITVLGYMPATEIPRTLRIGDPYAVTGEDSRRACFAISALAQGLHKEGQAALCKFVKSKDSDPLLAALFPLVDEDVETDGSNSGVWGGDDDDGGSDANSEDGSTGVPCRLYLVQLPFAKEVNILSMASLDDSVCTAAEATVADDLIDSMMLPDDCLRSEKIANPAVRSYNKTLIDRAINPKAPLAFTRVKGPKDPMSTPQDIIEKAKDAIDAFLTTFPTRPEEVSQKGNRKAMRKPFVSHVY